MKRLLAILPLMATVFFTPSCNITIGGDDTVFEYETKIKDAEAEVNITWSNGANLSFDNDKLKFTATDHPVETISYIDSSSTISPKIVKIVFKTAEPSTFSGRLDYSYTNIKTGASAAIQVELTFEVK